MDLRKVSPLRRAIGVVLIVVGGVWFLQGIGMARGSVMTGVGLWAVLGVVFIVAGAIVLGRRPRSTPPDDPEE
jgi:hypothetical protein